MRVIVALFLVLAAPAAAAEVYKWTDENGVTHFGNQPPPGQREEVKIRDSAPGDLGAGQRERKEQRQKESEERQNALESARKNANEQACKVARNELESAERMLTLSQSADAYDFVLERRQKAVNHWKTRVRIHCEDTD